MPHRVQTDGAIIYAWFSSGQLAAVDMTLELHFALEQHELRDFLQSWTLRGLRG